MKTKKIHPTFFIVFSLALFLLTSCGNLFAPGKSSLTVKVGMGSTRTVVPDFAGSITAYDITLSSQDGFPGRTASAVDASYTFSDLEAGSWDVTVTAYAGTEPIATGSAMSQVIAIGSTASVSVDLSPVAQTGTGDFSLAIRVSSDSGITKVGWRLENAGTLICDDAVAGTPDVAHTVFTVSNTLAPGPESTLSATTGVSAGSYVLALQFFRGTEPAGTFREAVNIWGGLNSNKWIMADGTLAAERLFGTDEFFDRNTGLIEFNLSGGGLSKAVTTSPCNLGVVPTAVLNVRVQAGFAGQTISYRWNPASAATAWTAVATNADSPVVLPALALKSGSNTLELKVLAADGTSNETFTVTMTAAVVHTGSSDVAMEMVELPGGAFQRDSDSANISTVGSFLIGRYLVTQEQFMSVMGWTMKGLFFEGTAVDTEDAQRPAENLTWYDAVEFCNKLSRLEGLEPVYNITGASTNIGDPQDTSDTATARITSATVTADLTRNGYRLPTWSEMVWMSHKAYNMDHPGSIHQKTDDTLVLSAGSTDLDWLLEQSIFNDEATYFNYNYLTDPVGGQKPNAWGLYDVYGNVSQWLHDQDTPATVGGTGAKINYAGGTSASRVFFGGSASLGSAAATQVLYGTDSSAPEGFYPYLGFRVVRSLPRSVIYHDDNASSGTPPVDAKRFLEGNGVQIKDNTNNLMRGPMIQDGITQRFLGWSRTAGATSPDAALTAAMVRSGTWATIGNGDLDLYPVWTSTAPANSADAMVGMVGPAGGMVFVDKGSVTQGWRYMEVSPVDVRPQTEENAPWVTGTIGTYLSIPGAVDTSIGGGAPNTLSIVAAVGTVYTYGARFCSEFVYGGFDDWFLPSRDELGKIHDNLQLTGIADFTAYNHMSSSQADADNIWVQRFEVANNGEQMTAQKGISNFAIRAVRYFSGADTVTAVHFLHYNSSGTLPGLLTGHAGRKVRLPANADITMRGPAIQDGITQRLAGWSLTAGAVSPDYSAGASYTLTNSDVVFYPVWIPTTPANTANAMVGMVGPAGGVVVVDKGAVSDGWRYMEAATGGNLGMPPTLSVPFSNVTNVAIGTTGTQVGDGYSNSLKILGQLGHTNSAAQWCRDYSQVSGGTTFKDFFLPSVNEMIEVDIYYILAGQPLSWDYWTSSENTAAWAYNVWTDGAGNRDYYDNRTKDLNKQIKPVRTFRDDANPMIGMQYHPNGATSGIVQEDSFRYKTGETVSLLPKPVALTKTGYTFKGWNTKADGTGILLRGETGLVLGDSFPASENLTWYANWTDGLYAPQTPKPLNVNGTNPNVLYSPRHMVRVGEYLYCTDASDYKVKRVALADGAVSVVSAYSGTNGTIPMGIDSDGTYLYVADWNENLASGYVWRIDILNNTATPLCATGGYAAVVLSEDKGTLYFVESTTGKLCSVPVPAPGGTPTVLQSGFTEPWGICRDSTNLYVSQYGGQIFKVPLADLGTKTQIATANNLRGIATDGLYIYAAEWLGYGIRKIRISDGNVGTLYVTSNNNWGVHNDGVRLYYAESTDNIMMLE